MVSGNSDPEGFKSKFLEMLDGVDLDAAGRDTLLGIIQMLKILNLSKAGVISSQEIHIKLLRDKVTVLENNLSFIGSVNNN